MKTTVEIPDELYLQAKRVALMRRMTVRSLLEEALRKAIEEHERDRPRGVIRDASVGGGGMNPEFVEGGWEAIRDEIYEGRGA